MNTKAEPKLTLYHFDYRVAQFPFATPVQVPRLLFTGALARTT